MLTINIDIARRFILGKQGLWLEDAPPGGGEALGSNKAFAEALACGFARFVTFPGARELDVKGIQEPALRKPLLRKHISASKEAK